MKFCLRANQIPDYLKVADEIKVEIDKPKVIESLLLDYPDKDIIIQQTQDYEWNNNKINEWNILSKGHMVLCLNSLEHAKWCKENNIRFFYGYPISSYFQLEAIVEAGSEFVRLDAPLFFDLQNIKELYPTIKIRAVPNVAYNDGFPRIDGVCGTWIRPEDMEMYDDFIESVEFENCDVKKEQAMYRIYANDKNWPTELGLLITNFNHTGVNRMISSDLTQRRLNCKQSCMENGRCHICYRLLDLANPQRIRDYEQAIKK